MKTALQPLCTAQDVGLLHCTMCGCLSHPPALQPGRYSSLHCPRCGVRLHRHQDNRSIEITWALLIAAAILYIPANTLPIMSFYTLSNNQPDTILSGVFSLWAAGQWPLAVIVFLASIVVPLLKLLTLGYLLVSIQMHSRWRPHDRVRLYRFTEYIGRWSMLDVFVIAILVGLVQFGTLARVEANAATFSFAAVVVLTMLAARTLDAHLIWKHARQEDHHEQRG